MKYYDFERTEKIIENEKRKGLIEVELGMLEDWFWTGVTIWTKETSYNEDFVNQNIAGIKGSFWATPWIILTYENGEYKEFEISSY